MHKFVGISATAVMVACLTAGPAWAQLNLDLGIADVTVDVDARNGLNVDVGANALGSRGVDADVGVSVGRDSLVDADVNANVGGSGGANANVGARVLDRNGNLLDADVVISIGGSGSGNGGATPGTPGAPGAPGTIIGGSGGAGAGATANVCLDQNSPIFSQIASIDYSGRAVSSWSSATSAQLIPVALCPGLDGSLSTGLLGPVAAGHPAVQAALSQSSYSASNVIGVVQAGSTLNVYVN